MQERRRPVSAERTRRLNVLSKGYDEVLDAVKHQDDKIGRLLTGLSFLTAATLAVAGLGGARYVTRRFDVDPWGDVPLALIFLGVFIGAVVLAVSLLLAAFSTPLRLPGQRPQGNGSDSTIYFYDIARQDPDEWHRTATRGAVADIEARRVVDYAVETHNLAARAKYKYDRVSEATTILVTAMLALVLAAVLTLVAAADGRTYQLLDAKKITTLPALPVTTSTGYLVGAVVLITVLIRYQAIIRYQRQTTDDLRKAPRGDWVVALCVAVAAGSLVVVYLPVPWVCVIAVAAASVIGIHAARWREAARTLDDARRSAEPPTEEDERHLVQKVRSTRTAFVVTLLVGAAVGAALALGEYGVRAGAGVAIYGVLGLSEFVRSLLRARQERIRAVRPAREK